MKYSNYLGVAAAVLLILACFAPWAYYPDIDKTFTGFFSEGNVYGRPGRFLSVLAIIAIFLFLAPRVWAKRANILLAALILAFCIKSWVLFTACYRGICPEKKAGIFLLLIAAALLTIAAILPRGKTER